MICPKCKHDFIPDNRTSQQNKYLRQLRATEYLIQDNIRSARLEYLQNWDKSPDVSSFRLKGVAK